MKITLKKVYNINHIKQLWDKLYSQNPLLSPFQEYIYAKNIFNQTIIRGGRINVFIVAYADKEAILIAPLTKKIFSTKKKNWGIFGDIQGCDITDFIYNYNIDINTMKQCIIAIRERCKGAFNIRRLNENSIVFKAMKELYPNIIYTPYKYVKIPPQNNYEEYIANLSRNSRQNVRKAYSRLGRDNKKYQLIVSSPISAMNPELWDEAMNTYITRQIKQFNVLKKRSIAYTFHYFKSIKHDTKSLLQSSNSFISVLKIDNKVAGCMMGFIFHTEKSIQFPRIAMNDEFKFYSPGLVMISETMKYIINNTELRTLDLTRGDEQYKYKMGGQEYYTYEFFLP